LSLGQPSRGATSLRSASPKFAIARAAKPIFSPSCGLTRTIAGAGGATADAELGSAASAGARFLGSTLAFTMEGTGFSPSKNLALPTPLNAPFKPQRIFADHYPRRNGSTVFDTWCWFGEPLRRRRA